MIVAFLAVVYNGIKHNLADELVKLQDVYELHEFYKSTWCNKIREYMIKFVAVTIAVEIEIFF